MWHAPTPGGALAFEHDKNFGAYVRLGTWQKHNVLSDAALPEEFKLALAESLQHGIFSSVRCPLFFLERFALVMTRC